MTGKKSLISLGRDEFSFFVNVLNDKIKGLRLSRPKTLDIKSRNDYVTEVDLYIQERIASVLLGLRDVPVLSEENFSNVKVEPENYWVLDPLDGTSNFINEIPNYAISIALISSGVTIFSFVFNLCNSDLYTACINLGSYKNREKLEIAQAKGPALVGVSTGYMKVLLNDPVLAASFATAGVNFRNFGSQALQLCLVAEGKLVANYSEEAKVWDDVAGELILREAGYPYTSDALVHNNYFDALIESCSLRSIGGFPISGTSKWRAD